MREDAKASTNHLHWHDGTTCHGFPSAAECIDNAIKHGDTGKVLEKTDTVSGRAVKCYSLIVGSFDYWAKYGRFVAETFTASRSLEVIPTPEMPKNVIAYVLDGAATHALAGVGTDSDRGCPACRLVMAEGDGVVFDARGRYWHQRCASQTLAEHTRLDEDRASARYRWRFDFVPNDISDADLDVFIEIATAFPINPDPRFAESNTERRRRFREAFKAYHRRRR
jgi:hypothetical protein